MNLPDFFHADCDALIFGYTNILVYIFDFYMSVYWSCTC